MIGNIIGGALGIGGAVFGGIKASRAAKKMKRAVELQKQKNQDWYDRRYNEDATQRADAQRMLTMVNDAIIKRNKAAQGAAQVMGATDESVALAKETNNEMLGNTASQIVASGEARKDAIEQSYLERDNALTDQLNGIQAQKAQAITGAINGVASAGAGIAGSLFPEKTR